MHTRLKFLLDPAPPPCSFGNKHACENTHANFCDCKARSEARYANNAAVKSNLIRRPQCVRMCFFFFSISHSITRSSSRFAAHRFSNRQFAAPSEFLESRETSRSDATIKSISVPPLYASSLLQTRFYEARLRNC